MKIDNFEVGRDKAFVIAELRSLYLSEDIKEGDIFTEKNYKFCYRMELTF